IQQIDTPMVLYERPANLFVATFLGSPAMNVLRGRLDLRGSPALLLEDGTRLALPGLRARPEWDGRTLALGLRPEHLLRADRAAAAFEAVVEVVEPVGSEVFVNLRAGGHALVARLPPVDLPRVGETLPLRVATEHVHLFEPDGGKRLEP